MHSTPFFDVHSFSSFCCFHLKLVNFAGIETVKNNCEIHFTTPFFRCFPCKKKEIENRKMAKTQRRKSFRLLNLIKMQSNIKISLAATETKKIFFREIEGKLGRKELMTKSFPATLSWFGGLMVQIKFRQLRIENKILFLFLTRIID